MTRPITDHDRLIERLATVAELGEAEKAELRRLPFFTRQYPKNFDLVCEGDQPTECCLILDGVAARYKLVAGGRRQILSFHFSGDLPDLQSLQLEEMDHGVFALTPVRTAFIPHAAIRAMTRANSRLNDILIRQALIDASIFREWVANIGRRSAFGRITHVFCEIYTRMAASNLINGGSFRLPITQAELGDATGLSPVHVNRVLQRMRREGLIASKGDVHTVMDWERLRRVGDFNTNYLHLRRTSDEHRVSTHYAEQ